MFGTGPRTLGWMSVSGSGLFLDCLGFPAMSGSIDKPEERRLKGDDGWAWLMMLHEDEKGTWESKRVWALAKKRTRRDQPSLSLFEYFTMDQRKALVALASMSGLTYPKLYHSFANNRWCVRVTEQKTESCQRIPKGENIRVFLQKSAIIPILFSSFNAPQFLWKKLKVSAQKNTEYRRSFDLWQARRHICRRVETVRNYNVQS